MVHRRHAFAVCAALLTSLSPAQTVTTIMIGLNSPRGLALAGDGSVYVAEAGYGGSTVDEVAGVSYSLGRTGRVSMYSRGKQFAVSEGHPSLVGPHGVVGPSNIAVSRGIVYMTIGLGGNPALRDAFPAAIDAFATLCIFPARSIGGTILDLGNYESTVNPDGGAIDSNPYGIAVRDRVAYVVDAGGNSLSKVGKAGDISTLAVFPKRQIDLDGSPFMMDAVPTAVAFGPDGAFYVSQLTGFPFPASGANVYRVVPGSAPAVHMSGFTTLIDLEFDKAGNLYVLQYPVPGSSLTTGDLIKVSPLGVRTTVLANLVDVTGFALGKRGEIYISSGAFSIGNGVVQ